ncbi:MAG: siderophore-interacting protein, partial [Microbacterium sp.]
AAASVNPDGSVLVFGRILEAELADEHDYEGDLIEFALTGGGARDHDEHEALFAAAGLAPAERTTIGWGLTLYTLAPGER